ncbi:MAG TPA: hypothetical protein PKW56_08215, partial [Clostridiales bacterium]|nr:hypothetical protein [Clostridiales bacterium]
MKKLIVLLIAITLMGVFLSSCSEDEKTTTPNENPEDYLFQGMSIVQTGNSDFEYIANDTEGNMVLFDTINGVVRKAVCRSAEGEWAEMQFDSNGLPVSVYSEDHVIFIGNIDDGKADFSIYEIATGSTTIYRDVTFNITKMTKGWYGDISYALEVASSALWAFN